jgi:hypothetical protein
MKRPGSVLLPLLAFLGFIHPYRVSAQISESRLIPDDGEEAEYFGWSVALSGEYLLIGASEDDDQGAASGSAYIFRRVGDFWVQHQKLLAGDGSSYDTFGNAVAISDSFAVIGAQLDDDRGMDAGAVYVFTLDGDTWVEHTKLTASDGEPGDHFGSSVSISGGIIVAGASLDDDNGLNSGSAYVFRGGSGGWAEEEKLLADDGEIDDRFDEVGISGNTIIVGAWGDHDQGDLTGSAYIFTYSGSDWIQDQKLTAEDAAGGDQFGLDVAISGDRAIVGAYGNDDNGENSGAAYVFRRDGDVWIQEEKLLPADGADFDEFGLSVSINNDLVLVGADVDDDNGENSGSAYVFRRTGTQWTEELKITASDGEPYDYFGISVALDADRGLIGAGGDDQNGADAGAAYVYEGFAVTPAAIVPVAPSNGAVVGTDTVRLVWNQVVPAPDRYWVEWSTDSLFTSPEVDSTLTDTTLSVGSLQNGQTIWWRGRAGNAAGWGPFNDPWTFSVLLTGADGSANAPRVPGLTQNYPNPFNPATRIAYTIDRRQPVILSIHDLLGRQVSILVNETKNPGTYETVWDASGMSAGVYYCRMVSGGFAATRKLLLVR